MGAAAADDLAGGFSLMAAKIIEDDRIAPVQGWSKHLLNIGSEQLPVDWPIDHPGGIDPVMAQGADEGRRFPIAMRSFGDEALTFRPPSAQGGHVGLDPGFIDENQAVSADPALIVFLALAFARNVWPVLFTRPDRFF
jgi:hypothetical protein